MLSSQVDARQVAKKNSSHKSPSNLNPVVRLQNHKKAKSQGNHRQLFFFDAEFPHFTIFFFEVAFVVFFFCAAKQYLDDQDRQKTPDEGGETQHQRKKA